MLLSNEEVKKEIKEETHEEICVVDLMEQELAVDETIVFTPECTGYILEIDYLNDHSYSQGVLNNCLNEIDLLKETMNRSNVK